MDTTKFNICPNSKAKIRERFFKLCNNRQSKPASKTFKEVSTKIGDQANGNIILGENEDGLPMITSVFSLAENEKSVEQATHTSSFKDDSKDELSTINQNSAHAMSPDSHNHQHHINPAMCVKSDAITVKAKNSMESICCDEGKLPVITTHDDKIRRLKDLLRQQEQELEKVRFKSKTSNVVSPKTPGKKDLRIRLLRKTTENSDFPIESLSKTGNCESRTTKRKCNVQESDDCLEKREQAILYKKQHCSDKMSATCVTIAPTNCLKDNNTEDVTSTIPRNLANDCVGEDNARGKGKTPLLTVEGLQKEIRNLAVFFRNHGSESSLSAARVKETSKNILAPSVNHSSNPLSNKAKDNVTILPITNTGVFDNSFSQNTVSSKMLLQPVHNEKGQTLFYVTRKPATIAIGRKVFKESKAQLECMESNKCQIVSNKKIVGKTSEECGFIPNAEDEDFSKLLGLEYVVHTLNVKC